MDYSLDDDELLELIEKRRRARRIRDEVISLLRVKAEPTILPAIIDFAVALGIWILLSWKEYVFSGSGGSSLLTISTIVPIILLWRGYRSVVPDPRDRFLLLLAREAALRSDEPFEGERKIELPPAPGLRWEGSRGDEKGNSCSKATGE